MHQVQLLPDINDSMMAGSIMISRATDEMAVARLPRLAQLGRLPKQRPNLHEVLNDYPLEKSTPLEAEPAIPFLSLSYAAWLDAEPLPTHPQIRSGPDAPRR